MKKNRFLSLLFAIACVVGLASCNVTSSSSSSSGSSQTSGSSFIDYAEQLKLEKDFKGKDFLQDGIGPVRLKNSVDGDTAHFLNGLGNSNFFISGRFNGIDTPESTGVIEEWGKTAAKYTADILKESKTIILESEIFVNGPEQDGNGRYLVWVWVSPREYDQEDGSQLRLLNLDIVQNSYGQMKGVSDSIYKEVFLDADAQARKQNERIWSNKKDPNFNYSNEYKSLTLEEIFKDPDHYVDNENSKVEFDAVVTRTVGDDAYVQNTFIDELTGEERVIGVYIFTMYNPLDCFVKGNLLRIRGDFTCHYGNYQVVNVKYSKFYPGDDKIMILEENQEYQPKLVTVEQAVDGFKFFGGLIRLNNLTVVGGYGGVATGKQKNGMTLEAEDVNGDKINIRISDDASNFMLGDDGKRIETYEYYLGKTFDLIGIMGIYESDYTNKEEYQINLLINTDCSLFNKDL